MYKSIGRVLLVGFLCGQLLISSCITTATIARPGYEPFLKGQPISEQTLEKIRTDSPKDAVFADLLQAFALMRTQDLNDKDNRKRILGLLEMSVSSFEDMTDPVNFSKAFSVDEFKAFRGRPHERMFASTMAAVFLMADQNFSQALPYLINAEFLDARFQKMPFGTDAPLIYALMYRCFLIKKSSKSDLERAENGVFRSVRFLTMQKTMIEAMVELASVDIRPTAIVNRLAYMIYEISVYHSLMTAPNQSSVDQLLDDAAKNASIFIATLRTNFDDEYKARMKPLVDELAHVYGMNSKAGIKHLEELAFDRVGLECKVIAERMQAIFKKHAGFRHRIEQDFAHTKSLSEKILRAASSDRMILNFLGTGPKLEREGAYKEISVVKPSPEGSIEPTIRERDLKVDTSCGFHRRGQSGEFSVVLCKAGADANPKGTVEVMPSLELLSLSRKATTAQGRKFDEVLRGRAQFRAATEKVAEITAWSALFLFYLGSKIVSDCNRQDASQACYSKAYVIWAVAGATAIFSGTAWLIGRARNPAADSRYIHLMYESVFVSI